MDPFSSEPDSAELLMMDMEIPEPMRQEDRDLDGDFNFERGRYHNSTAIDSDDDFDEIMSSHHQLNMVEKIGSRVGSFLSCNLSKEFSPNGFVCSGEFERFVKNEHPMVCEMEEEELELFGLAATRYSPIEEPQLFGNLLIQRLMWIEKRSLTRAQIFASNSMTENDEDLFEIESVLDDISTFCLLLRNSAYTLSNDRECGVTFDHFHNLIQLLHLIHMHAGKLSEISKDFTLDISNKSNHPKSVYLHVVLTLKMTIILCLGHLTRSKNNTSENNSEKVLPRFYQFVGLGWNAEILTDNHVDVLSPTQLDRIYHQMTFGLVLEIVELTEKRLKMFEISTNSDSFAFLSKQSAFSCSCIKEICLMLVKIFSERPKDIWSNVAILFETISSNLNNLLNESPSYEHNSCQLQFEAKEFPIKLSFWLLHNIVPLLQLSATGQYQELSQISVIPSESQVVSFLENVLRKYLDSIANSGRVDEIELRAFLNVVLVVSCRVQASSNQVLISLWELFHLRLNESFTGSLMSIEGLATLPHIYTDWIDILDKLNVDQDSEVSNKNSFELFLAILSVHLSDDSVKAEKISKQFFGRVRIKLPPAKWPGLEERGLFHILSLYLVLIRIRNDPGYIIDALVDCLSKLQMSHKKAILVFKCLCAITVCLMEKCKSHPHNKTSSFPKVVAALTAQMEPILISGDALQQSTVVQNYAHLLSNPVSLSSDLVISQPAFFIPCLMRYLEKKATAEIIRAFYYIVMRLSRFYQDLWYDGTNHLNEDQQATKKLVDTTTTQIWRLVYPLLKTYLCSFNLTSGPFVELAELAYGLALFSHRCTSEMKSLWIGVPIPPFENPVSIFRIFGTAHQIHPLVSCIFLKLFLQGDLSHVVSKNSIIESWSRVAILLQAQVHFASEEITSQMEQATEEFFKLDFIKKINIPQQNVNQDSFHRVIIAVGIFIKSHPNAIGEIETECEVIISTFTNLLSRQQEDEKIRIRYFNVGAWMIRHWTGPLLYSEGNKGGRDSRNMIGAILNTTVLKRDLRAETYTFTPNLKKAARNVLPMIFQGLASLLQICSNDSGGRLLRELFSNYLLRFEAADSHPMAKILQTGPEDMRQVQTCFFSFVKDPLLTQAKSRQNRPALLHALGVVKHGLAASSSNSSVAIMENLVLNFFPCLMEIYISMSHDEPQIARTVEDIFKSVLQFSRNTRGHENNLHRVLESDIVTHVIRERMPRCIADNIFALLTIFAGSDRRLVQNLSSFLQETVARIEQQRHMGDKTGHLTNLLNKLFSKLS